MLLKKHFIFQRIILLFVLLATTPPLQSQVHPVIHFDPYDCPNCTILFNLIGERLKIEKAEVLLARPFASEQDRLIFEQKHPFLKANPVHERASNYLKTPTPFAASSTLGIAVDSQLVWQKAVKDIKNIDHYFKLLTRTQARKSISTELLLSSHLQFFPVTQQKAILADPLTKQVQLLDLATTQSSPLRRPSIKELYQLSGFEALYPAYEAKRNFIETYGLDSITFKQAVQLKGTLYLSYALPWIYKTDSSENFSSVQVLLELDTTDFSLKNCYGFEKERGIKENYFPYFKAPYAVEKKQYLLPLRKEGDFRADDSWLAWYKRKNGRLYFDRLLEIPYPEACNNTHHQSSANAIWPGKASVGFVFHPCIFDWRNQKYLSLDFPQNSWSGTGLAEHHYSLMAFQELEEGWMLLVFLAEQQAFYWAQVNQNGKTMRQERLLEKDIHAAAFVGEQLLLQLGSGQLLQYPLSAFRE